MLRRVLVQTALWLAAMGAVLFLAAGDWRWPQAWLFLGGNGLLSLAVSLWLLRHDPALLAARLSGPLRRDQAPWDRIFLLVVMAVFVGWLALIGLDARRGWSRVPCWAEALGAALIALGMGLTWLVFRVNTFAAPQVRVQAGRGHHVVTAGPYGIVRHPMYAGGALYLLGTPLLLGSWWGTAAVPVLVAALAMRIVGEERMLRRELPGYDDYARRVRSRLLPGVW